MSNRTIAIMQALLLLGLSQSGAASTLAYVDDSVLAQLRGRYVNAGEIVQFGIQMVTIWHDSANGSSGIAKVLTSNTRGEATLTQYSLNNGSNSGGGNNGALSSTKGVVQLNQLAGQQDQALNSVQIEVNRNAASGNNLPGNWQQQSQVGVSGTPDMSIKLSKGSAGQIGQTLGQGQLMQYSTLNSNHISTSNTLRLQLWLQPAGNLASSLPSRIMMNGLGGR